MTRPEDRDRVSGACSGGRHLRERAAVGSPELERPVRPARDLVALLVHRAVMPAAEQREIRELRRAALRPVVEMMGLNDPHAAPGKAAGPVSMQERAAQGGRNGPGPRSDLHDTPPLVVAHDYPARVTRQAAGRSRGNVGAVLESGLARLIRIGQHRGVDMDDHLVALPRRARIEGVVQRRLRHQR